MSQLSPNLNVMIQAAEKAARSLTRDFGEVEKLQVSRKGPGDFVSRADTRAEEIIHGHLSEARPGYGFMMEEGGEIKSDSDYRWIIDPLDGTNNFLHGVPYWCISIALEHKDEIIAGVVYNPISDEMFRAEKGRGAFMNRQRLRVSGRDSFETSLIALSEMKPNPDYREGYEKRLRALIDNNIYSIRRFGCCALDIAYVSAGRFEVFCDKGLKSWDMAAGALLVKEAGGVVTDFNLGQDYLNNNEVLCGNPAIHRKLADLFEFKKAPIKKIV